MLAMINFVITLLACLVISPSNSVSDFQVIDGYYFAEKDVKSATLLCIANSDQSNITWQWYRNYSEVHDGSEFSITSPSPTVSNLTIKQHVGYQSGPWFACSIHPGGDLKIGTLYAVPTVTIQRTEKSKTIQEGEDLELNCNVSGWPLPNVTWRHKDNIMDLTDMQNVTSVGFNSISVRLNVKNMNTTDRGDFVCEATNFFNNTEHVRDDTILVRVKDNLAPLWPFLGIVAEVVVLAIIIGVYEMKKAKQRRLDEQKEANAHTSLEPKASHDSSNVRQRK